jgi:hypothetical protein
LTIEDVDQGQMLSQAEHYMTLVRQLEIDSDDLCVAAGEELVSIVAKKKARIEQRMAITRPLDASKASIMALFKPALDRLEEAETLLRNKITVYAEAKRQRQLTALGQVLVHRGETLPLEAVEEAKELVIPGVGFSGRWVVDEIVDPAALLHYVADNYELCKRFVSIETAKLNRHAQDCGGACVIPGVTFKKVTGTRVGG